MFDKLCNFIKPMQGGEEYVYIIPFPKVSGLGGSSFIATIGLDGGLLRWRTTGLEVGNKYLAGAPPF